MQPRCSEIASGRPGWRIRWRLIALGLIAGLSSPGCDDDDYCEDGRVCFCGGGSECFLDCPGGSCNLECGHTAYACGSVCRDHCTALCHDTNECSAACGADCSLSCHHVVACGAECGPRCEYHCHDATRCGVRVGPDSSVFCASLDVCEVECAGRCTVSCSRSNVNRCSVTCSPGYVRTDQRDGTITCR